MARVSPTSMMSAPASLTMRPPGASYAVSITSGSFPSLTLCLAICGAVQFFAIATLPYKKVGVVFSVHSVGVLSEMPIKSEFLALEGINIQLETFPGLINWHPPAQWVMDNLVERTCFLRGDYLINPFLS